MPRACDVAASHSSSRTLAIQPGAVRGRVAGIPSSATTFPGKPSRNGVALDSESGNVDVAAGGVLTAKQAPHRPGTPPTLGLRARGMTTSF
jgi:hypothetical protein